MWEICHFAAREPCAGMEGAADVGADAAAAAAAGQSALAEGMDWPNEAPDEPKAAVEELENSEDDACPKALPPNAIVEEDRRRGRDGTGWDRTRPGGMGDRRRRGRF